MQCSAVEFSVLQCSAVEFSAVQCREMQCSAVQGNAVQYTCLWAVTGLSIEGIGQPNCVPSFFSSLSVKC